MAFIDLLRQLMQGSVPIEGEDAAEIARGIELRGALSEDPNDIGAFQGLAELVDEAASSSLTVEDPLTADQEQNSPQETANLAMWSLAEELSGRPNAWYPLIELARLSVESDIEGATRRLQTAIERDHSGKALGEAIKVLREAGYADSGISLGIGYWDPAHQKFAAGEQLILAAIDANRPDIASTNFKTLEQHAIKGEHEDRLAFLSDLIEKSEQEAEARYREREQRES